MLEAEAVAVELQDVDVMSEPVEQRAGEALRSEHGGPFVKRQVRGDDSRAAFVTLREDVEQQFGAGARERHITQLVDDQQLHGLQLRLQLQQAALVSRFAQQSGHDER